MKRLFAAIKLYPDEQFLQVYYSLKQKLKYDKIKWVEPENIHLTLKFFGEIQENRFHDINKALSAVTKNHKPFKLSITRTGIFGSRYKPRIIWFGIDCPEIKLLGEDVLNTCNRFGFFYDRQNFVPHLTVGRIKNIENKKYFQKIIDQYSEAFLQTLNVMEFVLFESILHPTGPIYKVIERYPLICV